MRIHEARPSQFFSVDTIGGRDTEEESASEGFSLIPTYADLNKYHLAKLPPSLRHLDVGTGPGSVIRWCQELGLYLPNAQAVGIEINEEDIQITRKKFKGVRGVHFVLGSAKALSVKNKSVDRVTAYNDIHLFRDDQGDFQPQFIQQAYDVLEEGGTFAFNTAYAKGVATNLPERKITAIEWLVILTSSTAYAGEQGYNNLQSPPKLDIYTEEQYVDLTKAVGFSKVTAEKYTAAFPRNEAYDLVCVKEFRDAVLPGVPREIQIAAMHKAVDDALKRTGQEYLYRGWLMVTATK